MLLVAGYKWNSDQAEEAAADSARQDYALCVIQNENRETTRTQATVLYSSIAHELRTDPPSSKRAREVEERRLDTLESVLEAQRPINCASYVRPDLPPDRGEPPKEEP
jgi:hypothetical protein